MMAKVARLLDRIVPKHYRLDLDVDMQQFRFSAAEEMQFDLMAPSRELVLHAVGLEVTAAEVAGAGKATAIALDAETQTVTFTFAEELPVGEQTLKLAFTGSISESLHGFYRSKYLVDGQERFLAATQFEAVHAREGFVCVDEPAAKAVFELSLTVPEELTAIANTNATGEEPAGSGRKRVRFAPTPQMSTYLVAYLVGEFEFIEGKTPEGVAVRVYATPGQTSQLDYALQAGMRTLSYYTEYFGLPYPLPKLDMIAVPDFASGAMENWGAVTYRETALLVDPSKTSLGNKQRVVEVVAHELAHQWFGNLVTMAWWDDLWLNEGFATWVASLAMDHLYPEWQTWTTFIEEEFAQAQELDGLANTHPIQVPVDDPRHLDEIFDAISYAKGASVINMMHRYLGAEAFRKGLGAYLKRHSYSNTVTGDLWQALGEASGKPVAEVMAAWTSQPGYPLLTFEDGEARQQRFYSSPREAAKTKEAQRWPVPFGAWLADGETEQLLLEEAANPLPDELMASDWFKPNPGQTAFYRSHYTAGMIAALTPPMREQKLAATDRYGVVNDVVATTEAGISSSADMLKLVAALREEPDYVVWGGVSGGLGSLGAVVEDDDLRDRLDGFGRWLVQPNLKRLGWEARDGEPVFDTLMRPVVLQQAIRFDDEPTVAEAKRRFQAYLDGGALDADLRPAILYAAARHGGVAEFDALEQRYEAEASPQMKISLLGALGRFRQPELIARFLKLGISDKVRPQDLYIVLAWGFRNRDGRDQTWAWMQENWPLFMERYGAGGHMLERFPLYAGMGFATHKMAREIHDFFTAQAHPATKRPTAQAVESVELKADWYERDKAAIEQFLAEWEAQ